MSHLSILPTLPDSVRTLAFELSWRPSEASDPEAFLKGLESSCFDGYVEQGLEKIIFMPRHPGHEMEETMQRAIRTHLAGLDMRGLLHIDSSKAVGMKGLRCGARVTSVYQRYGYREMVSCMPVGTMMESRRVCRQDEHMCMAMLVRSGSDLHLRF